MFEDVLLAERVHALPERLVLVRHQLPVGRQSLHRLVLEHGVVTVDVLGDLGLHDEERTVDPAFAGVRLLAELDDAVAVEHEVPVPRRGTDRRQGHELAMTAVKGHERIEVDVGQSVAPRHHEGLPAHVRNQTLDPTAGHGVVAGVDQIDIPVGRLRLVERSHVARTHVDRHRSVDGGRFDHVALDHLALVPEGDGELMVPIGRVVPHDVPQNRPPADLDEWFGPHLRLFCETRPFTSCEDSDFHDLTLHLGRLEPSQHTVTIVMESSVGSVTNCSGHSVHPSWTWWAWCTGLRCTDDGSPRCSRAGGYDPAVFDEAPQGDRPEAPRVTVAVCTRNRGTGIVSTVDSILSNDEPDFELLIVDQSTDDATADAIAPYLDDHRIKFVRSDTVGIGPSRHLAVELSRSEYIAFTDDDCVVPSDWVRTLAEIFDDRQQIAMIYCNVVAAPHDPTLGFVPAYERPGEHVLRGMRDKCRGRGIGAGMALRRTPTLQVGNFDPALGSVFPSICGEEGDLTVRLLLGGYPVLETDRTHVEHDGFRTWAQGKDLTRRNFIGIGLVYSKPVRCGHARALLVVAYEGIVVALLQPLRSVLKGRPPRGVRAFVYFWLGFARGLRHPIDRTTMNFSVPEQLLEALRTER